MYRELQPLRQALSAELRANLPPAGPGIEPEHLLQTYLDRLTLNVGCDVADQSFTLYAEDASGEELGHLMDVPNHPQGFERAWNWLDNLRGHHHLRIILLGMETSGIYYWAWWDFLAGRPNRSAELAPKPGPRPLQPAHYRTYDRSPFQTRAQRIGGCLCSGRTGPSGRDT